MREQQQANARRGSRDLRASLLTVALLAFPPGCGGESGSKAADPKPRVTVAEATRGAVPISLPFSGTIKAVKTVQVVPHVSGYIGKRYFTEGSYVEEGDPLYRIDPRPFEAALDKYLAELAGYQADLAYWTSEVERVAQAAPSGAVSKQEVDQAAAKKREAQASVDKSQAQIDDAKLDLGYTDIVAPFDARTQQTRLYEGDLVDEYEDVLTTLVQMDPVHVIFNASRRELFEMRELERKGVVPPLEEHARVELLLPDGAVYAEPGKLDFVSAQIDPNTDTVTLRAVVANQISGGQEALVPGQYVPVRLVLGKRPDAVLIPQKALVETQGGKQVLVVGKDDKVESRKIEIASRHGGKWVIESGLEAGERVIVEGLQKARPGMVVDPEPAEPAKAKPPTS